MENKKQTLFLDGWYTDPTEPEEGRDYMLFGTLLVVYIGSIMILRWLLGRSEFQKQLRLVQE